MRRPIFTRTHTRRQPGSWVVRGRQVAAALGATAVDDAPDDAVSLASAVVAVKRPLDGLSAVCAREGVPLVYDVVDAWPQPHGNQWSEGAARRWLRQEVLEVRPQVVVAATTAMQRHLQEDLPRDIRVVCIPHHARPNQQVNPVREEVRRIGYEGCEKYIEEWLPAIYSYCRPRNIEFVVNPEHLADLDIVLAVRGGRWRGWATDNWKSGVKLSCAQGSGTPIVLMPECGARDVSTHARLPGLEEAEMWVSCQEELAVALEKLAPHGERLWRSGLLSRAAVTIDDVAVMWRTLLADLA